MRRVFPIIFFLFFVLIKLPFVYADTTATSGGIMSVEGLLIPGVTCGVPNDPDPGKSRCCVPKKQDENNKWIITATSIAKQIPVIGSFVSVPVESYIAIQGLSSTMDACMDGSASTPNDLANISCICIKDATSSAVLELNSLCTQYFSLSSTSSNEIQKCSSCMMQTGGFYTSIGCIPLDLATFISSYILGIGIGIAGGVALLCIMYSAFRMQTSRGNAEAIKKAQESMTACITGLIIIIFSVLILKIIGVDILRIPGLG